MPSMPLPEPLHALPASGGDCAAVEHERIALAIVRDALGTNPAEREQLLLERCGIDTDLRVKVNTLLLAVSTCDLHTQPSHDDIDSERELPRGAFGAFQPLHPLGRGGTAEVWLAQRHDGDFGQQVALKIMHPGLLQHHRRFRDERQILARLHHPNIAVLIDSGVASDGRPWLALEYVEGACIRHWCRQHRLGAQACARLMLSVCAAVEYAHRNLIIHRDIKPSNILVTTLGVPKLLDFGIAKRLDGTDAEQTQTLAMTPAYASPEQRRGDAMTTASDVFQLGLVLRDLFTSIQQTSGAGNSDQPLPDAPNPAKKPLQLLPSKHSPLCGDLAQIVNKATRDDPAERYGTAHELADDLRRWMNHQPILARQSSVLYRARKFLHRNRLAASLSMLIVLSLLAGGVGIAWQTQQARQEAALATLLKEQMIEIFGHLNHEDSMGRTPAPREVLDAGAWQRAQPPVNSLARREPAALRIGLNVNLDASYAAVALTENEIGDNTLGRQHPFVQDAERTANEWNLAMPDPTPAP